MALPSPVARPSGAAVVAKLLQVETPVKEPKGKGAKAPKPSRKSVDNYDDRSMKSDGQRGVGGYRTK
jgi:hypothetical protein